MSKSMVEAQSIKLSQKELHDLLIGFVRDTRKLTPAEYPIAHVAKDQYGEYTITVIRAPA